MKNVLETKRNSLPSKKGLKIANSRKGNLLLDPIVYQVLGSTREKLFTREREKERVKLCVTLRSFVKAKERERVKEEKERERE